MKYNIPDRVIKDIFTFARKCAVQKVILFGSRARGTHTERSDMNLDSGASEELTQEIEKDGVVIYEEI